MAETCQLASGKEDTTPIGYAPLPIRWPRNTCQICVCLVAELIDSSGKTHSFRQVAFILPPTPIPFLVGLQVQRSLSFDLCLRNSTDSHLNINQWNSIHQLAVNSHVWLPFKPVNSITEPDFNWKPLISDALRIPAGNNTSTIGLPVFCSNAPSTAEPTDTTSINIERPWERDDWHLKLSQRNLDHLHQVLRHPQPISVLHLFRKQQEGRRVPQEIRDYIATHQKECRPCAEHAELPRVPKLAIPPPATPNIAVTLDVMPHYIRSRQCQILVILDIGDMMLRLCHLADSSAQTAFDAYFSRWISIFDAPIFTVVDRSSNLANKHMAENLRTLESQLCPIPTEASWSLGRNERSHLFLHKAIDRLLAYPNFDRGHDSSSRRSRDILELHPAYQPHPTTPSSFWHHASCSRRTRQLARDS